MLQLAFTPSRSPGAPPLARQLADLLITEIRRGRLQAGLRLPGTRALATQLGLARGTVVSALDDIESQGWLRSVPTRGIFVAEALTTDPQRRVAELPEEPGFALPHHWVPELGDTRPPPGRGIISLASGMPDPRLVPVVEIGRAWRRVLARSGHQLLGYGHPQGHPALRANLAELLASERGLAVTAETLLITRGSQMALDVVARTLIAPGDTVAVERLGYRPAWHALRLAGAHLEPIPLDAEGLNVEALEALVNRRRIRAVYVTPHHQYPTTATLSASRRVALLKLARRHRFAILEDDYDHEFHYEGRPVLPVASLDTEGLVVSIGTLSKILAPGLRVGFVSGPRALITRMTALRRAMDRQGDLATEAALAELIEDGSLQRHVRKMRLVYQHRRDVLVRHLQQHLPQLRFSTPRGGISLWARVQGVDVDRWAERCEARGVRIAAGRQYAFDGRTLQALRLVFAPVNERELAHAVAVMAACVDQ